MPPGEISVNCPACNQRMSIPIAAVKRDNFYCSKCFQKIPLSGVRPSTYDTDSRTVPARPKKSSRPARR